MAVRTFDIVAAIIGLAITLPLYPFIALSIKMNSRGPVFYRQERVGLEGRSFGIIKFRTMVDGAPRRGDITLRGDARVTKVGRWLRRFEIDELPTLLNVLVGDMSVVGPRPEVPRYVKLYDQNQRRVLSVRPGLTGLATLRFRNETELLDGAESAEDYYVEEIMPEKLRLNLEHIDNRTFLCDLGIVFETLFLVVRHNKK